MLREVQPTENRERQLAGKIALITGSSRDIGASIAITLAKEGVNIIGNYREKKKRADAVENQISRLGFRSEFVEADITDEQDREKLKKTVESFGGNLDFLVLNASGKTADTNVTAANALVDILLPEMKKGGKIVLMQSVPGHFQRELSNLRGIMPDFYIPIALSKYEGEQSLKTRIKEFDKKGISLIVVCPPEVSDTFNMRLFQRMDPQVSAKHARISDLLGISRTVTKDEVSKKVAELLKREDLPIGHVELFGNTIDARSILSLWYGYDAIFVDTLEQIDETKGIGRLIISMSHTLGHFKKDVGIYLFPGHLMIEACAQTLGLIALRGKIAQESMPIFHGVERIKFLKTAKPGDVLQIHGEISESSKRGFSGNAKILNQRNLEIAVINGIRASILKFEVAKRILS